ncbi:DUF1835 domain-containing protein [Anaerobacillus sp. CMMVII]|uniref:DUF1835 domain-containing protein n=1 Tax=Anaerobacillus sp. CMMVII TaxID=2755588 RepID=UPI0021B7D849|nr:DUF1835 domain-containing protein [Anaerobacillus sp. CMMVII]MCT8136684.1 DUF1835 domain-containing protein [Anaerobacillus sp. CMMVII]
MIHILFGKSPSGGLKYALEHLGSDGEDTIISFDDMFSIGPIWKLHDGEGEVRRFDWLKNSKTNDNYQEYKSEFQETSNQIKLIPDGTLVTIWTADNAHEQTGLRYVLRLLKDKDVELIIINTTDAHNEFFQKKNSKQTILHTGEVSPEKLHVLYKQMKQASPLSQQEREDLEEEWLALSESKENLRIWRNGRIVSVSESHFDELIIYRAKKLRSKQKVNEYTNSVRLIGEVFGHLDQYVGDAFLEYRLRKLIEAGIFDVEGSLKSMRYYSVKLKQ